MPWVPETFRAWFPVSVLPCARKNLCSGTQGKSAGNDFVTCCDSFVALYTLLFFLGTFPNLSGKPVVAWQVLRIASAFSLLDQQRIRVDAGTFSSGITYHLGMNKGRETTQPHVTCYRKAAFSGGKQVFESTGAFLLESGPLVRHARELNWTVDPL